MKIETSAIIDKLNSPEIITLAIALAVVVGGALVAFWLGGHLARGVIKMFTKKESEMGDILGSPFGMLLGAAVIHIGLVRTSLSLDELAPDLKQQVLFTNLAHTLYIVGIFWLAVRIFPRIVIKLSQDNDTFTPLMANWIAHMLKGVLWVLCGATVIESWGISIAPVVAGMGVAGVALALSAQDFIKSMIAGMIVLGERKINNGDLIELGEVSGSVEKIGLRATDIRNVDNSLFSIPNSMLISDAIRNHSARNFRLIKWVIGLEYGTNNDTLSKVRDKIDKVLRKHPDISKTQTISVRICGFSASSIDIQMIAYVNSPAIGVWRNCLDELVQDVNEIVEDAGASFAFPSQTLYTHDMGRPKAKKPTPKSRKRTKKPYNEQGGGTWDSFG